MTEYHRETALRAIVQIEDDRRYRAEQAAARIRAVLDEWRCGLSVEWYQEPDGRMGARPVIVAQDYTLAEALEALAEKGVPAAPAGEAAP